MALVPLHEDSNDLNSFTFDLGSQVLSTRMKEFSSELDRYISRNQKKIINDKNQLTMELSELKGNLILQTVRSHECVKLSN